MGWGGGGERGGMGVGVRGRGGGVEVGGEVLGEAGTFSSLSLSLFLFLSFV